MTSLVTIITIYKRKTTLHNARPSCFPLSKSILKNLSKSAKAATPKTENVQAKPSWGENVHAYGVKNTKASVGPSSESRNEG